MITPEQKLSGFSTSSSIRTIQKFLQLLHCRVFLVGLFRPGQFGTQTGPQVALGGRVSEASWFLCRSSRAARPVCPRPLGSVLSVTGGPRAWPPPGSLLCPFPLAGLFTDGAGHSLPVLPRGSRHLAGPMPPALVSDPEGLRVSQGRLRPPA